MINSYIRVVRMFIWDFEHVFKMSSAAKLHGQKVPACSGTVNLFALSVRCQLHLHCTMLFSSYCITLSAFSSSQYSSPSLSLSLQTLSVVLRKGSSITPLSPHINNCQRAILVNALNTHFLKLGKGIESQKSHC